MLKQRLKRLWGLRVRWDRRTIQIQSGDLALWWDLDWMVGTHEVTMVAHPTFRDAWVHFWSWGPEDEIV